MSDEKAWFDDEAGPLVRPYALTRGRTRPASYDLDLITLVVARQPRVNTRRLNPEQTRILQVCEQPLSVAEVAAKVDLPLGVVRVLISDLIEQDHIVFRSSWAPTSDVPSLDMMQKVLDGIRKL